MADPVWVDGSTPLNSANMTKLQTRDEKGAANGYAALDGTSKVPAAQLPTPAVSVPTGCGMDWFTGTPPAGWLLCDGSAVSRTTYAALFAVIGSTYGAGDGSTTFNLPDTRGRVVVGQGTHADVATLGASDGVAVASRRPKHAHTNGLSAGHNLTLPDHWHNVYDPSHSHTSSAWTNPGTGTAGRMQGTDQNTRLTDVVVPASFTGIQVQSPQSFPGINGGVSIGGTIGAAGLTDSQAYLVATKIIKT